MRYLLSICIATYNRANYIGESLEAIINQATDEIEVVIVDGASTDNTTEIVTRYTSELPNIRYVRLENKGGVDRDFDIAIGHANGKYCWLLPDDDPLIAGSLKDLTDNLEKNRFSLIVPNSTVMDQSLNVTLQEKSIAIDKDLEIPGEDLNKLASTAKKYLTFIGSIIILKTLWLSRKTTPYYGSEFIHVGVVFQEKLPKNILILAKPYISIRYGNAQWTDRSLSIWAKKWPGIVWNLPTLSKDSKTLLSDQKPLRSLRFILTQRAKENINFGRLRTISRTCDTHSTVFFTLACLIPSDLLRKFLIFFMKKNEKKYSITLYDLDTIEKEKKTTAAAPQKK